MRVGKEALMTPDANRNMDALVEQAKVNAAAAATRDPGAIWRVMAGVVGVVGALLALASLPMPWYSLTNGPTYTGLHLLLSNQFAYTAPYNAQSMPPAGHSLTCMSGVVSGLSLPIGLAVALCVALLLLAIFAMWRAPRGRWHAILPLTWVVVGWLTRFFVYPWIMTLVNVNPYQVHGYSLGFTTGTDCAYPGVSEYGQSLLQVGLLILCIAGLLYGLLFLPSAARLAQVGAAVGLAAYLVPVNLAPLSFAGMPAGFGNVPISGLSLLLTLVPLVFALIILPLARVREREGASGGRVAIVAACLIGAIATALLAALLAAGAMFHTGVIIIGPGVNVFYLSALLLAVAGVWSIFRTDVNLAPDRSREHWNNS